MSTSTVEYLGDYRTKATHLRSGTEIFTDAPLDNRGKGEMFSPTDLVATTYASCMSSIVAMFCDDHGLTFVGGKADVTKVMASDPRRIGEIIIELDLRGNNWNEKEREKIIRASKTCPVAKSVNNEILTVFEFIFD